MNDEHCSCEHRLRPQPCREAYSQPTTSSSEIAELMAVKSKHGAGGEYSPDWKPKVRALATPWLAITSHPTHASPSFHILQEEPAPPPPPPAEEQAPPQPAKPAWRTVHRKPLVHRREPKSTPAAAPPPVPEVVKPIPSWSTWKRTSYPLAPVSWAHLIFILIASPCSESSTGTHTQGS